MENFKLKEEEKEMLESFEHNKCESVSNLEKEVKWHQMYAPIL